MPSKISCEVFSDTCCKKFSVLYDESRCKQPFNYLHYISALFSLSFLLSHTQMGKGLNPGILKDPAQVILNEIYIYISYWSKKRLNMHQYRNCFHFSGFDMAIRGCQLPKMPTIIFCKEGSKKLSYSTKTLSLFDSTEQNGQTITTSINMNTMNATKKARR